MKRFALAAALLALSACGGGGDTTSLPGTVGTCHATAGGCTSFTDLTTDDPATISFPGAGLSYSPQCARVRVGQNIRFQGGDFSTHPLSQSCGPVLGVPSTDGGTVLNFQFSEAGTYGYQCDVHAGAGMIGAFEVVP